LDRDFDLAIIGGGVSNGCRHRTRTRLGRGNSVFLCEMKRFGERDVLVGRPSSCMAACAIWNYYEFPAGREALIERESPLADRAPQSSARFDFVLPHMKGCARPGCCGLGRCFSTTIIGGRNLLQQTRFGRLTRDEVGRPLIPNRYTQGFEYSDCFCR